MELKKIEKIFPMNIEKYERFIPDISEGDVIRKMNTVIQYLNRIGHISSDVVGNWNVVMKWVLNEGLTEEVTKKINGMIDSGTFDQIINESQAGWKAEVDTELSSVNAELAQNASKLDDIHINVKKPPNGLTKAKGDGVTDDTVALQGIINYATQYGYPVFFPNGEYKITAPLTVDVSPVNGNFSSQPNLVELKGNGIVTFPFKSATRIIGYNIPSGRACIEITGATSWYTTSVNIEGISIEHDGIFNPEGFAPLSNGTCHDNSFCLHLGDARLATLNRVMLVGKNAMKLRCGTATYSGDVSNGWANISLNFTQCYFRGVNATSDAWAIKPEIYEREVTGNDAGYLSDNIKFDSCYLMGGIFGVHASIAKLVNCMFYNDMGRVKRTESTGKLNGITLDYSTCLLITGGRSISIDSCYWEDLNKAIDIVPASGGDIVSVNIDNCYINGRTNQKDPNGNLIDADYGVHIRNGASADAYRVQNVTLNNTVFRDYVSGEYVFNNPPVVNESKWCKMTIIDCSGDFKRESELRVVTANKNFTIKDTFDNTAMRTKTIEFEVTLANITASGGYDYAKIKDFPIDKYICAEKCWIQKITVFTDKQLLSQNQGVNFKQNALSSRGLQYWTSANLNYTDVTNGGAMYIFDRGIARPYSDWYYKRGDTLEVYIYTSGTGADINDNGAKVRILLDLAY